MRVRGLALFGSCVVACVSAYQALFSAWMTSHPVHRSLKWQVLFYSWSALFILAVAVGVWAIFSKKDKG